MANEDTKNEVQEGLQVVAFKLHDEEYGVSILNVQEIRNLTDITRVPFAAEFIKGVINLRGSVLPVIDLKQRLGLAETPYTDSTRIVTGRSPWNSRAIAHRIRLSKKYESDAAPGRSSARVAA